MSIAQQISELLSLKRDGLISADDVAFAIRELKAGASAAPHEEKKVAPPKPDVRANLKRARKAAKTLMTAVHKQAEAAAKKEVKRARAAKSAADDEWDRFLDETLEGAKRYDAEHNAEVKAGDFVGLPEDLPESKHAETADVKYERGAYYCVEFRVQLMDDGRKANEELI